MGSKELRCKLAQRARRGGTPGQPNQIGNSVKVVPPLPGIYWNALSPGGFRQITEERRCPPPRLGEHCRQGGGNCIVENKECKAAVGSAAQGKCSGGRAFRGSPNCRPVKLRTVVPHHRHLVVAQGKRIAHGIQQALAKVGSALT